MLIYLIIDINNIHIIIYWPLAHPPRPLFCCILFMHIIPLFGQPQVGIPGLGAASDPAEAVEEAEAGGADANDEAAPGQGHDDEVAPNGIQAHHTAGFVAINIAGGVEESAESVEPGHGHGHGGIGQAVTPWPTPTTGSRPLRS